MLRLDVGAPRRTLLRRLPNPACKRKHTDAQHASPSCSLAQCAPTRCATALPLTASTSACSTPEQLHMRQRSCADMRTDCVC